MYSHVYQCIAMYCACIAMYYHVLPCIAMYSHVMPCIPMYSHVLPCIVMYSHVMPCIAMYSHVYPCIIQPRLNIRSRSVLFLLFPTFVLFPIDCFLYTLLPSPRDKLEFLGQILIKWSVRYWLNISLLYFDTCFKQQRDASYDISQQEGCIKNVNWPLQKIP